MPRWLKSNGLFLVMVLLAAVFMTWQGAYTWRVPFEFPWWAWWAAILPVLSLVGMLLAKRFKRPLLPGGASLWAVLILSFAVDSICNLYAYSAPDRKSVV